MTFPLVPGGPDASMNGLSNSMRPLTVMASDGRAMAVPPLSFCSCDNPGEVVHLERRAPDERAVDVRLTEQLGGVVRLDAPAVLDAHRLGGLGTSHLAQEPADLPVHFLRLAGGGGLAGADGPDRLVREGQLADLLGGQSRERAAHLSRDDFPGAVGLALLQRFTHADDGVQAGLEGGLDLLVHAFIRLAEVLPPDGK